MVGVLSSLEAFIARNNLHNRLNRDSGEDMIFNSFFSKDFSTTALDENFEQVKWYFN